MNVSPTLANLEKAALTIMGATIVFAGGGLIQLQETVNLSSIIVSCDLTLEHRKILYLHVS